MDVNCDRNDECHEGLAGWQVASRGIELALNNRMEDGIKLLKTEAPCLHRQAGYCYITFINALMTFEEEKLALALATLRATEKRCLSDASTVNASTNAWSVPSFSNLQQSVKSRFWSGFSHSSSSQNLCTSNNGLNKTAEQMLRETNEATAMKLEQQIIIADCQVLAAIINFLHQDWGSYMKGGWVLRKAWKIYQKSYAHIRQLYIKRIGLGGNTIAPPPPSNQASTTSLSSPRNSSSSCDTNSSNFGIHQTSRAPNSTSSGSSGSGNSSTFGSPIREIPSIRSTKNYRGVGSRISHSFSVPLNLVSILKNNPSNETYSSSNKNGFSGSRDIGLSDLTADDLLPPQIIRRLMAAVSFGYGIFHLAVSLLPPKLLNIIHFLGFEGDRQTGIQALHFSRQGPDMRGPLATLALLWFHTIVRPFFGLDGSNSRSGADAAQRLIDGAKPDFAEASLFLFFQGRVNRLKCNFSDALYAYERALQVSVQREVRLLCLHEVGWSYVLLLQWKNAANAFLQLKRDSRWSKSFYCYLSSVCLGCCGDMKRGLELAKETPGLVRRSNNQLEKFLLRRAQKMLEDEPTQQYCLLLAYELLYLWNALGACLKHSHLAIQIDCEKISVPPLESVRHLILGSVYSNSGEIAKAKMHYISALREGELQGDVHTSAFASYELGMLLCKSYETIEEGRSYLILARDNYQNYDFENRLNVRIHSALRYYSHPPHPDRQSSSSSSQHVGRRNQLRATRENRSNTDIEQTTIFTMNPHSDAV